jgi:hypothetical protein
MPQPSSNTARLAHFAGTAALWQTLRHPPCRVRPRDNTLCFNPVLTERVWAVAVDAAQIRPAQ